jgi:hypothetical protein
VLDGIIEGLFVGLVFLAATLAGSIAIATFRGNDLSRAIADGTIIGTCGGIVTMLARAFWGI